jgi:hypothetical protein
VLDTPDTPIIAQSWGRKDEKFMATLESATAIVATPAIGGVGYQHCGELVVEYSTNSTIDLTCYPADEGNGSYGFVPITLPSTNGQLTKYFLRPSANKWKLLVLQFSSTTPFVLNFQGLVAMVKDWGSGGPYKPMQPFAGQGGEG